MTRHATLYILTIAALCELGALVSIISEAQRPVARCYKPWLAPQDERQACAIEAALAAHAQGRPRPARELRTGWGGSR